MPGVLGGEHLAVEDVTQVAAAVVAHDLDAKTICIHFAFDGILDFIIERRPSTAAMEFVIGFVEWRVAAFANVCSVGEIVGVPTGVRVLRTLVQDDPTLFRTQLVVFRFVLHFLYLGAVGPNSGSWNLGCFLVPLGGF